MSKHCRISQCAGIAKTSLCRCQLCVGRDHEANCWRHIKTEPYSRVNRRGQRIKGYDTRLETEANLWFADDAILTGLRIINVFRKNSCRFNFGLITPTTEIVLKHEKAQEGYYAFTILFAQHWFVLVIEPTRLYIYDSLKNYIKNNDKAIEFIAKIVIKYWRDDIKNLPDIEPSPEDLIQQTNFNDCGPFSLFYQVYIAQNKQESLVRNNIIPPTEIRTKIVQLLKEPNAENVKNILV